MNNEEYKQEKLKDPEYTKAYYLSLGEITTVDKIVNYLQDIQDSVSFIEIQWVIDEIKQRKWDPEWEQNE